MGMSNPTGGPNINVTPLIDVLLVLLVIFLVIIPVMVKVETVDVPPKDDGTITDFVHPPVMIKLNADATATVDDGARLMASDLLGNIKSKVRPNTVVFVDFEDGVPWGDVVGTVDGVRGLVADPETIKVAVRMHDDAPTH